MEQDLLEAKNYLSQQGYGSHANYTTKRVAVLLANYAQEKVKKLQQHGVSGKLQDVIEDCLFDFKNEDKPLSVCVALILAACATAQGRPA